MLLQCPSSWKCPFHNPVHASMGTSPLDYHGALSVITVLNPQLLWPDICFPSGCSAEKGRDTFRSINPSPQQTIMAGQESEPRMERWQARLQVPMRIPSGSFWGLCLLGCASMSPHENLESHLVPLLKLLQAANKPVQTPDSQGNPSKPPLSTTRLLAGVLSRQKKHWEEGHHNVS